MVRLNRRGLSRPTRALMTVALLLTVLHHADHVLRVDHSGWPFRREVTPFTFSLLAYPVILYAMFGPLRQFWRRWWLLALATLAVLYAHAFIETPYMQYAMWANDMSADPNLIDENVHNLLNLRSAEAGIAAAAVSMALNLAAIASCVAMRADGKR